MFRSALLYACATAMLCLLSGCLDIIEKLSLNRDGSGHYSIRVDGGSSFSMFNQFSENLQNQLENEDEEEYVPLDRAYDSVFYFRDFTEAEKANWTQREVLERGYRLNHVNDKKKEDWYELHFDFKDPAEIDLFLAAYKEHLFNRDELNPKFDPEAEEGALGEAPEDDEDEFEIDDDFLEMIWFPRKFSFNGNSLSRPGHDLEPFKQLSRRDQNIKLALAKQMNLSLMIEFPGKVISNSNVDFETKGKKTQIEVRLDEILEGEVSYETVIDFK